MHRVVVDEPYRFVPPYRSRWFSKLFRLWLKPFLRRRYGLVDYTFTGLEHLRGSLAAGEGIILCPNHSRDADPLLIGMICKTTPCHVFSMASWHIFKQSPVEAAVVRMLGGFSVFREGIDREALDTAVRIVAGAERPLVIFPEGVISRSNDRLLPLMDGVSFIARMAARKRAEQAPTSRVVVIPVGIRYELLNDPASSAGPSLTRIEQQTFWNTHEDQPLIDDVLQPYERRWFGRPRTGDVVIRVKDLRVAILPELLRGNLSPQETRERWKVLTNCYYCQTLSLYPEGYLDPGERGSVTPERIVETVHRLEEDLTDRVTLRPEWRVHFRIGEPIPAEAGRKPRGEDPLLKELRQRMLQLLGIQDWWPMDPMTVLEEQPAAAENPS
jgi:1-acyl-sn-glycerol-3-phosphate acyltransferase